MSTLGTQKLTLGQGSKYKELIQEKRTPWQAVGGAGRKGDSQQTRWCSQLLLWRLKLCPAGELGTGVKRTPPMGSFEVPGGWGFYIPPPLQSLVESCSQGHWHFQSTQQEAKDSRRRQEAEDSFQEKALRPQGADLTVQRVGLGKW